MNTFLSWVYFCLSVTFYPFYAQVMTMMRVKLVMVPEIVKGFLLQLSPAKIKPAA